MGAQKEQQPPGPVQGSLQRYGSAELGEGPDRAGITSIWALVPEGGFVFLKRVCWHVQTLDKLISTYVWLWCKVGLMLFMLFCQETKEPFLPFWVFLMKLLWLLLSEWREQI